MSNTTASACFYHSILTGNAIAGALSSARERERESWCSFTQLHCAYLSCRRLKRHTYHATHFEEHLESNLLRPEEELQSHTYRPSRSICFAVDKPVLREFFAASFRDRVVHHLLYHYLEPIFEPKSIHQSYACRPGKGIHSSLRDLQRYLKKATRNVHTSATALHHDINSFFMSLNKEILYRLIAPHVSHKEIL